MDLQDVLQAILGDDGEKMVVTKLSNGFQITFGKMYEAPPLNFGALEALSNLFGTKKIDVDDYRHSGCESCDYGSDYGHEIAILEPTKNVEEIQQWVGKDLLKDLLKDDVPAIESHLTEEQEWEVRIASNPNDASIRLVYSDWLEEHGKMKQAEYQRIVANIKK